MEILITALAIVACVLLFSLAVFIHEFGHFIAARKLGLRVEAFSIGFGPALWKKKYNGVEYRISLIPFGGYVMLPDLDPEGTKVLEGGEKDASDEKVVEVPAWKKVIVAFAGPFGNIVLAVALAFLLAAVPGVNFGEISTEISFVPDKGPAHEAGIRSGDKVMRINGNEVKSWTEMQTEIQLSGGKEIGIDINRAGENVSLKITPKKDEASGAYFIMAFSTTNATGAASWMPARNPLKQLAWDGAQIFRVLKALVTPKEAKAAASALGGPVMIAEGLYHQVRRNGWDALGFLRFLCINLAILNLLPIPVLDGGLILFCLFEILFRRKVPPKFVNKLSMVFMYIFLGLMVLLVWRDVTRGHRMRQAAKEMKVKTEKANTTNSVEKVSEVK